MVPVKNPCTPPPQVVKKPMFWQIHEIRQPFFNLNYGKWKPQISQRIVQNPPDLPTCTANHAKLA